MTQLSSMKQSLFLSHSSEEQLLAHRLKTFLEAVFRSQIEVFVSSDNIACMPPGTDWFKKIKEEIQAARIVLLLLGPHSIDRPWIHFEAGAAWLLPEKQVLPAMHSGLSAEQLPELFKNPQSLTLESSAGLNSLLNTINRTYQVDIPEQASTHMDTFISDVRHIATQLRLERDRKSLPTAKRSIIRLYQYYKSATQYRILQHDLKRLEAAHKSVGVSVAGFTKPHLTEVFGDLIGSRHLETTIIWLDEYWIKPLAEQGVLCPIGKLFDADRYNKANRFLPGLLKSGEYGDGESPLQWSVPHFVDVSVYLEGHAGNRGKELTALLRKLRNEVLSHESKPRWNHKQSFNRVFHVVPGRDHSLVYDFRTPDTCVAVMLEFLAAFGSRDSWRRICDDSKAVSNKQSISALKVLRALVGRRDAADFVPGNPVNFDDSQYSEAPLLRAWHSRLSDFPMTMRRMAAVSAFPIPGTLGGWHIGVLANESFGNSETAEPELNFPRMTEVRDVINVLCDETTQLQRFKDAAGLPTLRDLYKNLKHGELTDPITNWSLSSLGQYVDSALRRSDIPAFSKRMSHLFKLHNDIMHTEIIDEVDEVVLGWSRQN